MNKEKIKERWQGKDHIRRKMHRITMGGYDFLFLSCQRSTAASSFLTVVEGRGTHRPL
jgi:hypothetical protein